MPSKFGYQPTPLTPPDFKEFLQYKNNLNSLLRQTLHLPSKVGQVGKRKIKSNNINNEQHRNRNRSK